MICLCFLLINDHTTVFINPDVYGITFNRSSSYLGRIDRKIEFPLPDEKTKRRIFQIHTSRMTVADDVTLDDLIMAKDDLSGADIKVRDHPLLFSVQPQQLILNSPPVLMKHILTDNWQFPLNANIPTRVDGGNPSFPSYTVA